MTEFDDDIIEIVEEPQTTDDKNFVPELHKRWFQYGSIGGFLSIAPWRDGRKVGIEIGSVDGKTNAIQSTSKAFVNPVELLTYLTAVRDGRGAALYPKPSPESFVVFGGSPKMSRVFKTEYAKNKDGSTNTEKFIWKVGNFEAIVGDKGAIQPDYKKVISTNQIQVTRAEIALLVTKLEMMLHGWAAAEPDKWWFSDRK